MQWIGAKRTFWQSVYIGILTPFRAGIRNCLTTRLARAFRDQNLGGCKNEKCGPRRKSWTPFYTFGFLRGPLSNKMLWSIQSRRRRGIFCPIIDKMYDMEAKYTFLRPKKRTFFKAGGGASAPSAPPYGTPLSSKSIGFAFVTERK